MQGAKVEARQLLIRGEEGVEAQVDLRLDSVDRVVDQTEEVRDGVAPEAQPFEEGGVLEEQCGRRRVARRQ